MARRASIKTSAQRKLLYVGYLVAGVLARAVPPAVAYPILDLVGGLLWRLNRSARRAVEENLEHVIGGRGPCWRCAVRDVFRHGARNYYDTFRLPRLTPSELDRLVPVRGWEHLDAALAEGRGAILVGAHLSSLAVGGQAVAAHGYRLHVAVEPVEPPELLRLLNRLRSGGRANLIPLGPRLGADMVAALRGNEVVVLVVDRDVTGSGIEVPFFGRHTRLPPGPALLSLRTGAPILPAVAVRRADGRFDGVIEAPIPVERTGDTRGDVARITRAVTARLEYYIGRHPEQWTVFQPVWEDVSGGGPGARGQGLAATQAPVAPDPRPLTSEPR